MIDIHVHIGRLLHGVPGLTAADLIAWMDTKGIDRACVMAIENPEELHYYVTSTQVLSLCYGQDRLIPFCNIDPRIGVRGRVDFESMLIEYKQLGAKGFGEVIVSLHVDDEGLINIYLACGNLGLPVLIHMDGRWGLDGENLFGLRRALSLCRDTDFVLHSYGWWSRVNVIPQIFAKFRNAYGDLSGIYAVKYLSRMPNQGKDFLEKWQDRLMFGTDYLEPGQECPIFSYVDSVGLSEGAYRKITHANAARLLGLDDG